MHKDWRCPNYDGRQNALVALLTPTPLGHESRKRPPALLRLARQVCTPWGLVSSPRRLQNAKKGRLIAALHVSLYCRWLRALREARDVARPRLALRLSARGHEASQAQQQAEQDQCVPIERRDFFNQEPNLHGDAAQIVGRYRIWRR